MSMKSVSLDHLNFTVSSFAESVSWYKEIFGFELVKEGMDDDGPWGILRSGDFMLCIYESQKERPDFEEEKRHTIYHFGLRIRDRAGWESLIKEKGIRLYYGGAVRYPHSTSWYVKDPTGHMIEVALWDENQVRF